METWYKVYADAYGVTRVLEVNVVKETTLYLHILEPSPFSSYAKTTCVAKKTSNVIYFKDKVEAYTYSLGCLNHRKEVYTTVIKNIDSLIEEAQTITHT